MTEHYKVTVTLKSGATMNVHKDPVIHRRWHAEEWFGYASRHYSGVHGVKAVRLIRFTDGQKRVLKKTQYNYKDVSRPLTRESMGWAA